MPVKKKVTKKAPAKKRVATKPHHVRVVESDFIIITGGGFLVLALSAFLFLH